ncbi:MAG: Fe-S cluster assembly protein SufB [Patescibacteria group bacterium]|nr:Fe-S cluster assembly protein SufB [Patescibacteria group bacterium]
MPKAHNQYTTQNPLRLRKQRQEIFSDASAGRIKRLPKGLSRRMVEQISWEKSEPEWMLKKRLLAYEFFQKKPMPTWGVDLSALDFSKINFFQRATEAKYDTWKNVPKEIKNTFEKIGVPQAERKYLAGVVGQYDSEGFYNRLKAQWGKRGVIFCDTDTALQKYPDLVKEYFMTRCVPIADHKFAALHGAVWSGGSFLYVPAGVKINFPVQTYFRMNARASGQFEHTLIIVEEGAEMQYIEGCTAPIYNTDALHSAVVEIFVKKGARCRYTTVQNWSKDVYNLNTKRSIVAEEGVQEWVGGSLGSKISMLYPCTILAGRKARADHLNISLAGPGQIKDTGAKVIHGAPDTASTIISKSIAFGGGKSVFRGLVQIAKGAKNSKAHMQCDSLISDNRSSCEAVPQIKIFENDVSVAHEAKVGKISEEQIFYLMSRGLTEQQATNLIVQGFRGKEVKELPLEYAVELNRLIQLEMTGSVG